MLDLDVDDVQAAFQTDMISVRDRLPAPDEYRRVRHLILEKPTEPPITDDQLAEVIKSSPHLETAVLAGVKDLTDRTVVLLANTAVNLEGVNLTGCTHVTDIGVLELTTKSLPLQWIQLNGLTGLTDPSVSAIAKTCSRLLELELCDLPLLTPLSVRDIWSFSRKLRTLRLSNCPLLTDKAFPSSMKPELFDLGDEKPLPPRPVTWIDNLSPLILRHTAANLRLLDLTSCKLNDDAIDGIVSHAPQVQSLILSNCTSLTDRAMESIANLGEHLDVLILTRVSNITDAGIMKVARSCFNLRSVDVSFCRNLTDMAVFELAGLKSLRRLSLVRVQKLTDIAIFALAEHATALERLHLSYCDRISLEALHLLLRKLESLQYLTALGVPSLRRKGIGRFSDSPPLSLSTEQQAVFWVFSGENIIKLRKFLDKEDKRRREAEARSIPFIPRSDDNLDLY